MSQTKEGAQKAKERMLSNNPDYYREIGKIGGSKKNPNKGFGSNRELASTAGKKGGIISRRRGGKYGY